MARKDAKAQKECRDINFWEPETCYPLNLFLLKKAEKGYRCYQG
jgi:hypothetical protein